MNVPVDNVDTLGPWDGPTNNRHNIRVLCDLANLSLYQKNVITACIQQESGFLNTYVTGPNAGKPVVCLNKRPDGTLSSTDWGICQINDRYHIGPKLDFPSSDYVMTHPEEAVKFMIRMCKAGKLSLWVSFSSGAYLKYMPKNG